MYTFETSFPVRYYETDQMGIVHHSNYIRYFECARDGMLVDWGYPIEDCEKDGIVIPIISVTCRYRHPAKMGDMLTVSAEIEKAPLAKLYVGQKVKNQKGEICAEGQVVLGFLDAQTRRPVPCPEKMRDILEKKLNLK